MCANYLLLGEYYRSGGAAVPLELDLTALVA